MIGTLALALGGYSLVQIAIFIVVIIAVVALVHIGAKAMGVAIPAWLVQAFWIVVIAFVIIVAIKLVASM